MKQRIYLVCCLSATKVVAELGGIATDDLFSLLDPLDRATNWSDEYHHRATVQKKESEQVAASVLSSLAGVAEPAGSTSP